MFFDEKALGYKNTRVKYLIGLLKSPATMPSGIFTKFLPENIDELCDRLELSLQEKQAENNSNMIKEEVVAIADKFLECKRIPTKQHRYTIVRCSK